MKFVMVNGVVGDATSVRDRAFQFGDGLFETMLCVSGELVDAVAHWQRLALGCARLGIDLPDVRADVTRAVERHAGAKAVAKLVVTRGTSTRGYRPDPESRPTWALTIAEAPPHPLAGENHGVAVKMCRTRVSLEDPQLVGLKHLNRLPQVLARREWRDDFQDGLMSDGRGHLVEGCSTNVFVAWGSRVATPRLDVAGVRGIARQKVIDHLAANGVACDEARIETGAVWEADEIFLTNSVFGVLPVKAVVADGGVCGESARRRELKPGPTGWRLVDELVRGIHL